MKIKEAFIVGTIAVLHERNLGSQVSHSFSGRVTSWMNVRMRSFEWMRLVTDNQDLIEDYN